MAQLYVTFLSGKVTKRQITMALEGLPDNRDDAYTKVWDRIFGPENRPQERVIATTTLTWITYAKRRLSIEELLHAIALSLEPDPTGIDADDLIDVDLLISSCMGLVILSEDRTVRLVHYTTQDYLETKISRSDANTSIAKYSLTYLGFPDLEFIDIYYPLMEDRLVDYAAIYWGQHVREGDEDGLLQSVLSVLASEAKRHLIEGLWYRAVVNPYVLATPHLGFTILHFLSVNGLSRIVPAFLDTEMRYEVSMSIPSPDVDAKDNSGRTPLSLAAEYGHLEVVRLLVATGKVEVNSKDSEWGQTPLSWVAHRGRLEVVRLLVATGEAEVDAKSNSGQTPLSLAAMNGHLEVVRLLVATGKAEVDTKSNSGRTPLSLAAERGRLEVLKFLVREAAADVESKDRDGKTALDLATAAAEKNLKGKLSWQWERKMERVRATVALLRDWKEKLERDRDGGDEQRGSESARRKNEEREERERQK